MSDHASYYAVVLHRPPPAGEFDPLANLVGLYIDRTSAQTLYGCLLLTNPNVDLEVWEFSIHTGYRRTARNAWGEEQKTIPQANARVTATSRQLWLAMVLMTDHLRGRAALGTCPSVIESGWLDAEASERAGLKVPTYALSVLSADAGWSVEQLDVPS